MSSATVKSPDVAELTAAATNMWKQTAYEVTGLWWAWLVRAIIWAVLGILFVFYQDIGLKTLQILIAVWFILDGISSAVGGLFSDGLSTGRRLFLIFMGVLAILAGIAVVAWPDLSAVTLTIVAGIYGLMFGTLLLFSAVFDDAHVMPRWLQALLGIAGIAFGIYFIFEPETKVEDLLTVIGIFTLVGAVLFLIAAWQLRSAHEDLKTQLGR